MKKMELTKATLISLKDVKKVSGIVESHAVELNMLAKQMSK